MKQLLRALRLICLCLAVLSIVMTTALEIAAGEAAFYSYFFCVFLVILLPYAEWKLRKEEKRESTRTEEEQRALEKQRRGLLGLWLVVFIASIWTRISPYFDASYGAEHTLLSITSDIYAVTSSLYIGIYTFAPKGTHTKNGGGNP